MKKSIIYFLFILLVLLTGCNSSNKCDKKLTSFNDHDNIQLKELKTNDNDSIVKINYEEKIKVNKDETILVKKEQDKIKENTNSELMELNTKIREMTTLEFLEFFKEYNIFLYRSYAFFEYENDICVAVMFNDDYYSIKECYSYKKIISNSEVISQIKIGMTPMEVVKIIGIPKLSTTFGLSSLDFYINDSIIRIFLSSPDYIYDVRIIELQK